MVRNEPEKPKERRRAIQNGSSASALFTTMRIGLYVASRYVIKAVFEDCETFSAKTPRPPSGNAAPPQRPRAPFLRFGIHYSQYQLLRV